MKKLWKGFLAMALVACNLVGLGHIGFSAAAQTNDITVYDLTVNDLIHPLGIDTATPTFSWKLQSDTIGQKQTAYAVTVATDEALSKVVWNSGKISDNDTTDIAYAGSALSDTTRYYWQVTVYDMNGKAVKSPVSWFETAFLGDVPMEDSAWIEVGTTAQNLTTDYTFEADISCSRTAAAVLFNMTDTKNGLMWQLLLGDTTVKLRPHKLVNGTFTAFSDIDITRYVSPAELQQGIRLKLAVTNDAITTYINGTAVNTFATAQLGVDIHLGKFGTRVATAETYTLDNIRVTNYADNSNGEVLCTFDCETYNPLFGSRMENGKITLNYNTDGIRLLHTGTDTFRKAFTASKEVAQARLYVAAFGAFNAYMNGERIGNKDENGNVVYDELAPGWTNADYRSCYHTYDITDYLKKGQNTLTVGVNHGWSALSLYTSKDPATPFKLRAQMIITYTDGTTQTVSTDKTWKTATIGPILLGDIFQGEYYDATIGVAYRQNGFDDSNWTNAKAVTFYSPLSARDGGAIYVRKDLERTPQTITVYDGVTDTTSAQYGKIHVVANYGNESFTLKAGETAVVDFGQNFAGWENVTVSGAKGTTVRIRHAEALNDTLGLKSRKNDGPEGSIYVANLRKAAATTYYVLSGNGEENYRPTATYYGFRYIEITATADVTFTKIRGEVATSVTKDSGYFASSDQLINRLYLNTVWGQYSNYFGQATDCPQRDERLGYSGDAQVFIGAAVYNAQVKAFLRNFMQTLVEGQSVNGAYRDTLPTAKAAASGGNAGWADAGIIVPYTYYKQYGDPSILSEYYDSMAKYMQYLANSGAERPSQEFGDWCAVESRITNYISYVYTIWDTQLMQEIAALLGKTEDVTKWEQMEKTHTAYFREKFLDANGDLTVTTQTAYLFALKLDLYETEEAWQRGKTALVNKIQNNGNKLTTGFLGTSILMETLVQIGEVDLAYELLFQEENPSWLYSVKQGATTMWERWNSYTISGGFGDAGMNSFNHYAYGRVAEFMYNTILGIRPCDAGYANFLLAPVPTDKMTSANGYYDAVNGRIESSWALDANGLYTYQFTVPANTTATVKLEKQPYTSHYAVNGVAADKLTLEQNGAQLLKVDDQYIYFQVVSGKFTFACETVPSLSTNTDHATDFAFDNGTVRVVDTDKTANGYRYTVRVTPNEDYQLQAGSLVVADTANQYLLPTRVGFRANYNDTHYVFETTGGGEISATFYRPNTATTYNMGFIGTSYHQQNGGLRFVHRLYIQTIQDEMYMLYNGNRVQIQEYGVLLAAKTNLQQSDLTLETAENNEQITVTRYPQTDRYYDLCDSYVDIAAQVDNLTDATTQNAVYVTRTYIRLADADNTVIYGETAESSFIAAVGTTAA